MMPSLDQSPYVMMMTILTVLMTMDGDVMAQLWPNYPEPGPDIHGRFCSIRRGGCCPGRDDYCVMPILDTVCYCDEFCVRTQADCCPDFRGTCTHRPESQTLINNCHHNGEIHAPGTMITVNCNNCTCVETHMTMPEYNWKCTQKTCLVRDELLEHINTNSGRFGWRASNYTFLWGMTLDDGIKYRLGTLKPHSLVQSMTSLRIRDVNDVPMTFDARKEWPSYIHPVLDQGNCGSSWALSTASVAADRLTLHSQGAYADMLSAQQILDCDIDYKQKGCEGGHLDRAWWYMRATGVVSEPCYPYKSGDTQVRGKCQIPRHMMRPSATSCPSGARGLKSPVYQVAPPYRISPNEKEIMKEIMENGPVQALMYVREDFFLYKGGVYHHSLPADFLPPNRHKTGYHSVKILGWGTDYSTGKPLKYWLCANSWGRHWGEDGYFRILRGVNESEIESFILGVWGKVNGRELRRHNRRMLLRHRLRHNRRRLRYRRHLMRTS